MVSDYIQYSSKEGLSRPPGSSGTKVVSWRSPASRRNGPALAQCGSEAGGAAAGLPVDYVCHRKHPEQCIFMAAIPGNIPLHHLPGDKCDGFSVSVLSRCLTFHKLDAQP